MKFTMHFDGKGTQQRMCLPKRQTSTLKAWNGIMDTQCATTWTASKSTYILISKFH